MMLKAALSGALSGRVRCPDEPTKKHAETKAYTVRRNCPAVSVRCPVSAVCPVGVSLGHPGRTLGDGQPIDPQTPKQHATWRSA
jgi:hypothetical protein